MGNASIDEEKGEPSEDEGALRAMWRRSVVRQDPGPGTPPFPVSPSPLGPSLGAAVGAGKGRRSSDLCVAGPSGWTKALAGEDTGPSCTQGVPR
eukprot:844563-Pyramimonas_sp.AAC.1